MKSIVLLSIVVFWSISTFGQNVVDISKTQKITKKGMEITTFQEKPLTGVLIENHPNGKPKSWTKMKDGLPDGLWQEWYENGQLKFNAYWLAGKGHGLWEYYHENGVLRQEEFYNMDIPIGIQKYFYNNGRLKSKSSWLNAKKHGIWTFFNESGNLMRTEIYAEDKLVSTSEK
ncbi:MAG: toxin-antitoxin system YwqK family antitoxin [Flavobacteriaceae bacterium]